MVETSVVLLNYNGKHLLKTCLPSVLNQTYKDYEVILVDNGSTDGSMDWITKNFPKSKYPHLRALHVTPNCGFTGGNNYGAKRAKGKYIVLLSNDAVAPKNWLETLIGGMKRSNYDVATSINLNLGYEMQIKKLLKKNTYYTMNLIGENIAIPFSKEEQKLGVIRTFYSAGNALCYKRTLFPYPFDEIYFIYAEDVYLCWRARLKGAKVGYVLDSLIPHGYSASKNITKDAGMVASFNGMKNQCLNYLLFYRWYNLLRVFPLFAITQCAHMVYKPSCIKTKFKVYWWVLTHVSDIAARRRAMQKTRTTADSLLIKEMSYKFFDDPMTPSSPVVRVGCKILNGAFWLWCAITGLRTRDF